MMFCWGLLDLSALWGWDPTIMRGSWVDDCQNSSSSAISSAWVSIFLLLGAILAFGLLALQILLREQWLLLRLPYSSSLSQITPPPVRMQNPVCVLVTIYRFWCFYRLMFFSLVAFWVGLDLFTDLELGWGWKPLLLLLASRLISSLVFLLMLILVLLLNSAVPVSVLYLSQVQGLLRLEYFLRSWCTVLGSYYRASGIILLILLSCFRQPLEDSLRMKSSYLSPSKQGCFIASIAERRSLGFIFRSCFRKFRAFGESLPKYFFSMVYKFCISGNFMPKNLGFLRKVSQWSGVKRPKVFCMRKSWSSQFSPGNMGLPSMSSPIMQPTAQISISLEQGAPTSSQGGRYQRVATQSVISSSPDVFLICLAKPKSQILSSFLSLMSRFSGLMSLCMRWRECMQASPLSSWYMQRRISQGSSPSEDFSKTSSRLFCTYSKTKQTMPFFLNASFSSTMLPCFSIFRILTYRIVVFFTISSYSVSLNFLIATTQSLSLVLHLSTTPQAPSPMMPIISYFCILSLQTTLLQNHSHFLTTAPPFHFTADPPCKSVLYCICILINRKYENFYHCSRRKIKFVAQQQRRPSQFITRPSIDEMVELIDQQEDKIAPLGTSNLTLTEIRNIRYVKLNSLAEISESECVRRYADNPFFRKRLHCQMKSLNKSCRHPAKSETSSIGILPTTRLIQGENQTCFRKEKENAKLGNVSEKGKIEVAMRLLESRRSSTGKGRT